MFAEKKFFATAVCPREKQKPHRIHRCGDFNKYRRVVKYLPTPVLSEQVKRVRVSPISAVRELATFVYSTPDIFDLLAVQ
jgi:hypothetical protein